MSMLRSSSSKRRLAAAAAAALLTLGVAGCSAGGSSTTAAADSTSSSDGTAVAVVTLADSHADANDGDVDASEASPITLADGAISTTAAGVQVDGDTVTITSSGTYRLTGTLTDGQVVVDSPDDGKVVLVLDGADITSATSSPIAVTEADEVVVVLADGSNNHLSDGLESAADDEAEDAPNATLFSMADLTIAGTGSLEVTGLSADGIVSKDGLVLLSGTIEVEAADDGIRGKDYLVLADAAVTVAAGGDGVKSDVSVLLDGGQLDVTESNEGIEAQAIEVAGGTHQVTATDDGLNASDSSGTTTDAAGNLELGNPPAEAPAGMAPVQAAQGGDGGLGGPQDGSGEAVDTRLTITISGGKLTVDADGDGLDSNGTLAITGGTTTVNGPTSQGNGAIDAGQTNVTGGTLVAAGSAGMLVTPDAASGQAWVVFTLSTPAAAGTEVAVRDAEGDVVAELQLVKETQALVYSSSELDEGGTYRLTIDGKQVAEATAS